MTPRFFTNCRSTDLAAQFVGAIPGVISVLGTAEVSASPIGHAYRVGNDAEGYILWHLVVNRAELPGRWVLRDQAFEPEGLRAG